MLSKSLKYLFGKVNFIIPKISIAVMFLIILYGGYLWLGSSYALAEEHKQVKIVVKHTNQCLDVEGNSTKKGTKVQQWPCSDSDNQLFSIIVSKRSKEYLQQLQLRIWHFEKRIEERPQDHATKEELKRLREEKIEMERYLTVKETFKGKYYYSIVAKHSDQCLDVKGVSTKKGAKVQQWPCSDSDNQLFSFVPKGEGYYSIVAKHSDQCLDVKGVSTRKGAKVQQWPCSDSDNQLWKIE